MKVLIMHLHSFHYEIIPSIIELFPKILNKDLEFYIYDSHNNKSFQNYIKNKYNIQFVQNNFESDFKIYDTLYEFDSLQIQSKNYYIAHRISNKFDNYPNVFYLCPFKHNKWFIPFVLPFKEDIKQRKQPIFCVQGNIDFRRRDFDILYLILEKYQNLNFKIKIIGRGTLPQKFNKFSDKLILKTNLDFQDFHKEFLDCVAILPLINPIKFSDYFTSKLTSSISYGIGYDLIFFCHQKLVDIYNLKKYISYDTSEEMIENFPNLIDSLREINSCLSTRIE